MNIHGRNLLIYSEGSVVAAARSCRISMSIDTIETAGTEDGRHRCFVASMSSWTVSVERLVTVVKDFFQNTGQMVTLSFVARDIYGNLMGDRMTGNAFVSSVQVDGSVGALAKGSVTFQGSGKLERLLDALRDSEQKDLWDYDHTDQLFAPSAM